MKPIPCTLVLLAGALIACASYDVEHDWDVEARFADYHTYAWMERSAEPEKAGNDATAALLQSDLLDRRIRGAVDESLQSKGMTASSQPDLRVAYHVGLEDKIDVTDWDYEYSGVYWGWAGRDIGVYTREEGTLLVDLVDAGSGQMVWRGIATGAIQRNQSPEERDRAIRDVVRKMFEKFPPPR